jgi:hypothetical protein
MMKLWVAPSGFCLVFRVRLLFLRSGEFRFTKNTATLVTRDTAPPGAIHTNSILSNVESATMSCQYTQWKGYLWFFKEKLTLKMEEITFEES